MASRDKNKRGRCVLEQPSHSTIDSCALDRTSSKIQHTREHVENLKQRIDHELDKLKKFRDYFVEVGDTARSSQKPVLKVLQKKHMTWRENLEANRTRRNRQGVSDQNKTDRYKVVALKSTPESGNSEEKSPPQPNSKDELSSEKRPRGGWCWCCGQCSYPCTVYQSSYGDPCHGSCNCNCDANGCCNWNAEQQRRCSMQYCREVSPMQECQFGIPYRVFPRRTITDLNTQEYCRNAKETAAMKLDRAKKIDKKCQMAPSGSKRTESKSPTWGAKLKQDQKCKKNTKIDQEKKCKDLFEKSVKKEQKDTRQRDRIIKHENYENYIKMYRKENSRVMAPECMDQSGPYPRVVVQETLHQVEKSRGRNQSDFPSAAIDSDQIMEKLEKWMDYRELRSRPPSEEEPCCCKACNEVRSLPKLGGAKSDMIQFPWCTDECTAEKDPCDAYQENSGESINEAIHKKCLEDMACKPTMERSYFMEEGPTGPWPEEECLTQNISNPPISRTYYKHCNSTIEDETHQVVSKETIVRQKPRNERQSGQPRLGSRAHQYRSDCLARKPNCLKESPTQTEPQNMIEKALQVNLVRKCLRDQAGSQESTPPSQNAYGFRSGSQFTRKYENQNHKSEKDCGYSSRAYENKKISGEASVKNSRHYKECEDIKKEQSKHYRKENKSSSNNYKMEGPCGLKESGYQRGARKEQLNTTFDRPPSELRRQRWESSQATFDMPRANLSHETQIFQKEICKGPNKCVVFEKEAPTANECQVPSQQSHYRSQKQPKRKENYRDCNEKRRQDPCSQSTKHIPEYSQELQGIYSDSYGPSNQKTAPPCRPFNQKIRRDPTFPSFPNKSDCERQYIECMRRESATQTLQPSPGKCLDTRAIQNQREPKEMSSDSNFDICYQLNYHPSEYFIRCPPEYEDAFDGGQNCLGYNYSYHPNPYEPCQPQSYYCDPFDDPCGDQGLYVDECLDHGPSRDYHKSMRKGRSPDHSPKKGKPRSNSELAHSPKRGEVCEDSKERGHSRAAPKYSNINVERALVQEGSQKDNCKEFPRRSAYQQNRERSPYKVRDTSLSPSSKIRIRDSYKNMKPQSFEKADKYESSRDRNKQEYCREDTHINPGSSRRECSPQRPPNEPKLSSGAGYFNRNMEESEVNDKHLKPKLCREPESHNKHASSREADKYNKQKSSREGDRHKNESYREDDMCIEDEPSREKYRLQRHTNELRSSRGAGSNISHAAVDYFKREVGESLRKVSYKDIQPFEDDRHNKSSREGKRHQHESTGKDNEERQSSRSISPTKRQSLIKETHKDMKPESFRHKPESSRQRLPNEEGQSPPAFSETRYPTERRSPSKRSFREESPEKRVFNNLRSTSRSTSPILQSLMDSYKKCNPDSHREGGGTPLGPNDSYRKFSQEISNSGRQRSPEQKKDKGGTFRRSSPTKSLLDRDDSNRTLRQELMNKAYKLLNPESSPRQGNRFINQELFREEIAAPESNLFKNSPNASFNFIGEEMVNKSNRYKEKLASRNSSPSKSLVALDEMRESLLDESYKMLPESLKEPKTHLHEEPAVHDTGPHSTIKKGSNYLSNEGVKDRTSRQSSRSRSSSPFKRYESGNDLGRRDPHSRLPGTSRQAFSPQRSQHVSIEAIPRDMDRGIRESVLTNSCKQISPRQASPAESRSTSPLGNQSLRCSSEERGDSPRYQGHYAQSDEGSNKRKSFKPVSKRSSKKVHHPINECRPDESYKQLKQKPPVSKPRPSSSPASDRGPKSARSSSARSKSPGSNDSQRRSRKESPKGGHKNMPLKSPKRGSQGSSKGSHEPKNKMSKPSQEVSYVSFKGSPVPSKSHGVKCRPPYDRDASPHPYQDFDPVPEWQEEFESCECPDDAYGSPRPSLGQTSICYEPHVGRSRSCSPIESQRHFRRDNSPDGTYSLPVSYRNTSTCRSQTYLKDSRSSSTDCQAEQTGYFEFPIETPTPSCRVCPECDGSDSVCDKKARCVTFKDEQGDCSVTDWEGAMLGDGQEDQNLSVPQTCRSSSSAEHTCLESQCGEDCASCGRTSTQTDRDIPPFEACPCMYQTYLSLAAMCQPHNRYIQ
ncbi:uncharacterized protein Dana_GF10741, isoform B [Drosophila ananassae]|uniref:Uncharacterized protein, isoform B n=1 Tax=Drosophila ananassae TaxID=7217 RepID=B3M735_DROAN|nr:uncharacterized protein LOC6493608 isoform X2 [Drosophila ananassae]XP_014764465.1 uncharacterized protein LOC6493608 isoform X3 [Drosophila ananassae]EDV40900.2 uncharacterized protein Dana_GF10741, isoform C [Drosophila ananassae]KPU78833.1 uncharacterized protein Dana_GF10741, isoform B [Drosophila ananassae]